MFILILSILKGVTAASLPLITSIQDVTLLDYALTHKTVNSTSDCEINASSGLTANAEDTYKIDTRKEPRLGQDLYTSDEQRRRDQYEIDEDNWHEVAFEEINGTSTFRLALHNDWIIKHGYAVEGIVEMNLPEQGISGPFKITDIKHILPQKKPVDEDPDDEWEYKPVTGLFTHRSDQVHTLAFASADGAQVETLGVTAAHPIFSTTHHDWRLAGELEAGDKVLTYNGEATVLSNEPKPGNEYVYNLEVKDLHNFLVGDLGVVVHNDCLDEAAEAVAKNNLLKEAVGEFVDEVAEEVGAEAAEAAIKKGRKLTWPELKALFKRGNNYNKKVRDLDPNPYEYYEVTVVKVLNNGKIKRYRLDSYNHSAEIVSRKATDFDNITESTFRNYVNELTTKYESGLKIVKPGTPINGQVLQGSYKLEVPLTNQSSSNLTRFQAIAAEKNVTLIFRAE